MSDINIGAIMEALNDKADIDGNNMVPLKQNKIEVVQSLPANPDPDIWYAILED